MLKKKIYFEKIPGSIPTQNSDDKPWYGKQKPDLRCVYTLYTIYHGEKIVFRNRNWIEKPYLSAR